MSKITSIRISDELAAAMADVGEGVNWSEVARRSMTIEVARLCALRKQRQRRSPAPPAISEKHKAFMRRVPRGSAS